MLLCAEIQILVIKVHLKKHNVQHKNSVVFIYRPYVSLPIMENTIFNYTRS